MLTAFFTVLLGGTVWGQLCHELPTVRSAPFKEKTIGGVRVMYFVYSGGSDHSFELDFDENIFDKKTKTSCHKLSLELNFYNNGKKIMLPESVSLYISSVSNAYKYALKSARRLKIVADGETIFETELDRDENIVVRGKSYTENLSTEFDFATFDKFARKNNVTLFLGKTALKLNQRQIATLRQMLELVEKQPNADELFQ